MKNKKIPDSINDFHIPRWEELPNIDLYVDQVVGIIDSSLQSFFCDEKEQIITKTMINNYVKQGIMKAPVNKKYSREHLASIFVLSVFKKIYSINDISIIMNRFVKCSDAKTAYDAFCIYLEASLKFIFSDEKMIDEKLFKEDDLLKHAVLSFANYLYIKKKYLWNSL